MQLFQSLLYNIDRICHFYYFIIKTAVLQRQAVICKFFWNLEILIEVNTFWLPVKTNQFLQVYYKNSSSFLKETHSPHGGLRTCACRKD